MKRDTGLLVILRFQRLPTLVTHCARLQSLDQMFRRSDVLDHVVFLRRAAFLGMCADSLIVLFPVISEGLCLATVAH